MSRVSSCTLWLFDASSKPVLCNFRWLFCVLLNCVLSRRDNNLIETFLRWSLYVGHVTRWFFRSENFFATEKLNFWLRAIHVFFTIDCSRWRRIFRFISGCHALQIVPIFTSESVFIKESEIIGESESNERERNSDEIDESFGLSSLFFHRSFNTLGCGGWAHIRDIVPSFSTLSKYPIHITLEADVGAGCGSAKVGSSKP